jgi:thiamine-monophosphate kinase
MDFGQWGEEGLIEHLRAQFTSPSLFTGIGDDCAVIPLSGERAALVTTDALVEGVHFLKEAISPRDLGYKTVAVSVSDVAAMGGEPQYAFLSLALPKQTESGWVKEVLEGVKAACEQWGVLLLGGDTVGSKRDLFLNLTLMGIANVAEVKYRHRALSQDVICVTAPLGDSGGGLRGMQEHRAMDEDLKALMRAHVHPQPSPEQGQWLAKQPGVHAMMDLSDGLACDLPRLLKSSGLGGVIELSRIPLSRHLQQASLKCGWDPVELALVGGEDYCLLLTVDPHQLQALQEGFIQVFGTPLYDVGIATGMSRRIVYLKKGKEVEMQSLPFDHFR